MIGTHDWTPANGLTLEPNALTAVRDTSQNRALLAGPGAGKTEMLAQRADFLLQTGGCPYPRRILAISFKKDAGRNLKLRVQERSSRRLAARFDSFTFHAFAGQLIDRYRPALSAANALNLGYTIDPKRRVAHKQITYDDMIPLALEILTNSPAALGALRQTYSHLFLDEFQDCTTSQYQLIKAAFFGTSTQITAVGDTKQSIMGWVKDSLKGVFSIYSADFAATPLYLYQNHRSKPRLRRMQNRMVADMDPDAVSPDEDLLGDAGEIAVHHFTSDVDEAEHVADAISTWLDDEVPPSEIAVLVPKQLSCYAAPLMAALTARGIPHRDEHARQNWASEPVVALILDFLRVIFGESESTAYQDLMATASRSTSDDEAYSRARSSLSRYISHTRAQAHQTAGSPEPKALEAMVRGLLDEVGHEKLTSLASDYANSTVLEDFVTQTLQAVADEMAASTDPMFALRKLSHTDSVRILTVHKSKGLEFEKVVVLAIENEMFFGDIDEERQVFFVGISRAKSELLLTTAQLRPWPEEPVRYWSEARSRQTAFLAYAVE